MAEIVFPTVDEIEAFFFEASLKGYAGGGKFSCELTGSGGLDSKFFRYTDESKRFQYIDRYDSQGDFSRGETTIYFWLITGGTDYWTPIWTMSYHGWCGGDTKRYHKFLKERLRAAYERKWFHGGRGADIGANPSDHLFYQNPWQGDFTKFHGWECINELGDDTQFRQVFWHRFQGLLMLPAPAVNNK